MREELTLSRLDKLLKYNPETGNLRWRNDRGRLKENDIAGYIHKKTGHRMIIVDGNLYNASKLALFFITGKMPTNHILHRSDVKSDNCAKNIYEKDSIEDIEIKKAKKEKTKIEYIENLKTGNEYDKKSYKLMKEHELL